MTLRGEREGNLLAHLKFKTLTDKSSFFKELKFKILKT